MKTATAIRNIRTATQALIQANADLMLLQIKRGVLSERELKELGEAIDELESRFSVVAVQQSCFRAEYNQYEIRKKIKV